MKSEPDISVTANVGEEYADVLEARLRQVHDLVEHAPRTLSVALVDDEAMSQLHDQFLNIPGPTDVLTFELGHDAAGRVVEGEVVVCLDEARRQADERGHGVADELLLYAVHGLLHLSGFNDLDEADYATIHAEEDRLLRAIGVGQIFRSES